MKRSERLSENKDLATEKTYRKITDFYKAKIKEFSASFEAISTKLHKKQLKYKRIKQELAAVKLENIELRQMLTGQPVVESFTRNSTISHSRMRSQEIPSSNTTCAESNSLEIQYKNVKNQLEIAISCLKTALLNSQSHEKNSRLQNIADRWEGEVRVLESEKKKIEQKMRNLKINSKFLRY